jgi:quinol monooxygenase YgiN
MQRIGYWLMTFTAFAAGSAFAACDEVGYIATFEVTEGQEQAFEAGIVKVAAKVREVEEGTLLYSPYRGDNGKYYMMERYRNLAAREAHAKDPAVLELFGPVMETLSAEVAVESVALLCGEEAAQ